MCLHSHPTPGMSKESQETRDRATNVRQMGFHPQTLAGKSMPRRHGERTGLGFPGKMAGTQVSPVDHCQTIRWNLWVLCGLGGQRRNGGRSSVGQV